MEPFPPKPPSPFDPEGGNFVTVAPPLQYSGTRVFSFACSPGGVALTSNELRLLAAHPAEGGSEQAQQISDLVQRLLRDAAVEKIAFAELQTSIAQIRLRRDARVATLLGQPRESTSSGSNNGGAWIAALNEKVAAVERDAAAEERAEVAATERAQLRSQMAEVQVAASAAAAHNAAQELRVARQEDAEAAVAFAAAAENAAFATAAAESGAADDMESALAAVAAGAGSDATSWGAFGDGPAGSHWQTTTTGAAPMPSPDGGSSWAAPPLPAAATSGSGRVQLPPRRRSSRSGTPVQRSAAALDKASNSALGEAPTPEAPTVVTSHVPNADVAAAAAGSGGVPNKEIFIAAPSSSKAASAGLALGEAKLKATPPLSTTTAALPESQRFQHHVGSISDAELALEAPPSISSSSSRNDSDGAGSATAAADGGDHESEAQRAMRGFSSLRLRAKNGDAAAASKLGLALFCGVGQGGGEGGGLGGDAAAAAVAHPNVAKAVVYWTKAAKAGDVSAQCSLGVCYMLGASGSSGGSEKAGENGSSTARNNAAAAVPYKPEGAVKWWTRAAMAGCSAAMHNLGLLCTRGYSARFAAGINGGESHNDENESHANGSGSGGGATSSATSTAPAIVHGDVLPNPRAAFEWYSRAAALGHREAMNNLGAALCSGDTGDDDDDDNNKLSGASSGGGSLISSVKGRDPAGAASWYEKAANLGSAEAANNLGLLLWSGDGVPADPARAVALWNTAAAGGNPEAMCSLGVAYMTGAPGMASDKAAAVAWWQKAAQNGNANAQYNLSKAYQHGQGCKRSPPTAMKWCAAAAAQGHAQAAAALAEHERRRQRAALAKQQQQQQAAAVVSAAGAAAGANSSATAAEIKPQSSAVGERTSAPQAEGAAAAEPNTTKGLKEGKQASLPPVNIQESNTGAAANAGDGNDSGGQGAATNPGQRSSPGPLRQMLRRPGTMNNPDGLLEDYSNQQQSSEPSASPSGPRPTPVSSTAGSANGSVARPGPPGFPRSNSLVSTRHRSATSFTAQSAAAPSPSVNSRRSMTPTRRFPSAGSSSANGAASLSSPLNTLPRRPLRSRSQTPGSTGPSVIVDPAVTAASTTGAYSSSSSSSSSHRGRSNSAGRTLVTPSPRTRSPVIRRGVSSGGAGALSSSSARGRSPSPATSAGRQSMAGSAVATAGSATRSSFSNGYASASGAGGGLPNRGRSMPFASAKPVTPRARSNSPASNRFANKAALDHRRLVRRSPSQAPGLEGSGDTTTAAAAAPATSSGVAASSSGSATPGASPPVRRPVRRSLSQGMRPALASPSSSQQRGSTEAAAAQRATPSGSTARPARESALEALAKNGADAPANSPPGNGDGLVTYSAYAALVPGSSP